MIESLLLVLGFFLLVKGGDLLVEGASSLAAKLRVSEIVIGLTVVAFGTSTPELVVNVFAASEGYGDVAFGNIIGSNIVNILLILGISGLIYPLTVQKNTVRKEIPFALLAAFLLLFLVNDSIFFNGTNMLSRLDGLVLLAFFGAFIIYVFFLSRISANDSPEIKTRSYPLSVVFILVGLAGLTGGGKLVVDNAVNIAQKIGMSEKVIAATIVAFGTSMPELVTSAIAAKKRKSELAIGNIVGSNIFNILLVLGVTSFIRPVSYSRAFNRDGIVLLTSTLLLLLTMFTGKKRILDRWEAGLFLVLYGGYIVLILI